MSGRIIDNIGGYVLNQSNASSLGQQPQQQSSVTYGKVFGVITTKDTPTKELFEREGGFSAIGTIFYQDYNYLYKYADAVNLSTCATAKPISDSQQSYPLIGEIVTIHDAPTPDNQRGNVSTVQKYYSHTVNLWNNNQHNSISQNASLGRTFVEKSDTRNLLCFEGDRIYQGRKGNGIRFGSTVSFHSDLNEWSNIGEDGDPITILANGYVTTPSDTLVPNIEEINKEKSSIYLTSTQLLPLLPDRKDILNPLTRPLLPNQYYQSQIILNADRVTLNSKLDEVMIFATTNVEINTNNIINLNAGRHTHINSPAINLGTNKDGSLPTEPLLLGGKTHDLLLNLFTALQNVAYYLSSVTAPSEGSPIPTLNDAGEQLFNDIQGLIDDLDTIQSTQNFTA